MVSTRSRGRRFGGLRTPTPVVFVTLLLLVAMYLVVGALLNFSAANGRALFDALYVDADDVLAGQVWRLVTYGFLHDPSSPMHLFLNGLMLYFFGRDVELRFGKGKFVAFLLGALAAGGVAVVVGNLLGFRSMAIGFSGAVEACTVFWALTNRNAQVLLFFMLPIRGIHMLWLAVAQWVLDAVSVSNISASAHAGGILFGLAVYGLSGSNRVKIGLNDILVKLRLKKQPRLTVVPKNDRWVN